MLYIILKISGAMSKEMFREISIYFGIYPLDQVVSGDKIVVIAVICSRKKLSHHFEGV